MSAKTRPDCQVQTEPGDNTKYLNHSLTMMKWKQPDMNSVEAVEKRVHDYFALCAVNDMKPTFAGLALAFGVERITLWRWCNNAPCSRQLSDSVRNTLRKGYQILNAQMEDYMSNGKINPVAGIFMMKNNMNYQDQTELVVKPETPYGEQKSLSQIEAEYDALPYDSTAALPGSVQDDSV